MGRIGQQLAQAVQDAVAVGDQRVFQPVQRLYDPHGGTTGPVETTGRSLLEVDGQLVEFDRSAACIGVDGDAGRDGVRQAEIIRRRHAIHQQTKLVAPSNGLDDCAIVRGGGTLGQTVDSGFVVQPTVDTAQVARQHHALERLVDRITVAEVCEVGRHPDMAGTGGVDLRRDGEFEIGHKAPVRYLYNFFGQRATSNVRNL